jgi:hypothetical protein
MKSKFFISFFFLNVLFLSAQDFGIGMHLQLKTDDPTYKSVFVMNFDYLDINGMIYGFDIGFNSTGITESQDYSGNVNIGQFSEDITGDLSYNLIKFGGRYGVAFKRLKLIGSLGLNFLTEYQLRYDEYHILGDNGSYGIKTGNTLVEGYYKASILFETDGTIYPEVGFGNNGFSIGINLIIT